mmetsp:Transcript_27281/g.33275  ORF Transcript_27281/g.33275 Transcript_27281/m.33275 type:complete len:91 (+) Transcript_27281:643-915(+)
MTSPAAMLAKDKNQPSGPNSSIGTANDVANTASKMPGNTTAKSSSQISALEVSNMQMSEASSRKRSPGTTYKGEHKARASSMTRVCAMCR